MIDLLKESVDGINDFENELSIFFEYVPFKVDVNNKLFSKDIYNFLQILMNKIIDYTDIQVDDFKSLINQIKEEHNISGNVWKPIRIAATGKEHGPDISKFIEIIGADQCAERLQLFLNCNVS